jgi:DNA-directed RNA polymerase subunit RPC12/RpoP
MSINIHTNYYQANLENRSCDDCKKHFIVGQEIKNNITYCPYCGSKNTDNESWTEDDTLKELELGCLGIYYTEEQIEEISVEDDEIRCTNCNKIMSEGYEVCDGLQHYCSNKCLETELSQDEYKILYEEGYAFWTTFED